MTPLALLQIAADPILSAASVLQPLFTPGLIAFCAWGGKIGFNRVMAAIDSLVERTTEVELAVTRIDTACFGPNGSTGSFGDVRDLRSFNHEQRTTNGRVDERLTEHGRRLDGHDQEFSAMKRRSTDR